MDRTTKIERDIARRERTLAGLRTAGIAFLATTGAVLAAAIAFRCLGIRPNLPSILAALCVLAASAVTGFAIGHARRVDVPRLLLRVDLALGTGERLSSLHELRSRGGAPFLERRIEADLAKNLPAWQRVVRPRRSDVLPWLAGSAALAAALALLYVSGAAPATPPAPSTIPSPTPSEAAARPRQDESPPAVRVGGGEEPSRAGVPVPRQVATAQPLEDPLAELLPTPPTGGLLGPTEGAVEENRRSGGGSGEGLSNLLSEIERRRQDGGPGEPRLTPDEEAKLRNLVDELPDSSLRDALEAILQGQGGSAGEDVADALALLEGTPTADDLPLGGARQSTDGKGEKDAEAEAPGADAPASGSESGAGETPGAPRDSAEADESAPATDDGAPGGTGGESGRSGPEAAAPAEAPGLVPEELLSEWNASGDVRRFMTRGLPFEPPSSPTGERPALALHAETLRALFEARALAPELQDLVRTYFNTITQGEP